MAIHYKYAVPIKDSPIPGLAKIGEFVNSVGDNACVDARRLIAAFNPGVKPDEILILDFEVIEEYGLTTR